ncbi:ROK family transcriptional regulator [Paenibacillus sp. MMS20-IR301]|uniref:ROK family transcriptional regulator n=1 Tax=Paenibacillus sp. MMS20-IR301 TaxID=2895946 RepID=UPI0028F01BD2|nr:ROK family transcriptional regulator [Paenibacillus sp. MMS20-IR301]WNS41474.1 ROK family transcriptional regulator [Paenibacillus sp. MMS20-IR301]
MATHRLNSMELKKMNRNAIYRYMYTQQSASIQDIAQALNLSLPTVTQNLKELQERELVVENGLFESTGGRKAKSLACNSVAGYAIGLDVTRNHVGIVMIDLSGKVVKNVRNQFSFANNEVYFQGVGRLVEEFVEQCRIDRSRILGVGIALPAILTADRRAVSYATVIDFQGGSIERFAEFIPYPCILSNDANAAGFTELWGEKDIHNVVYLSLNNSVGGSFIVDNQIYAGKNHRGGEFGHMTIMPGGRTCYCGQKGCVDAYCSARILSDSTGGSIVEFFRLLKEGNEPQQAIWEEYLDYLVVTINNLRMLYDCDVILGGYAGAYMEDYINTLQGLAARKNTFEPDGSYLRVCKYKLEATAVGAALELVTDFIDSI